MRRAAPRKTTIFDVDVDINKLATAEKERCI